MSEKLYIYWIVAVSATVVNWYAGRLGPVSISILAVKPILLSTIGTSSPTKKPSYCSVNHPTKIDEHSPEGAMICARKMTVHSLLTGAWAYAFCPLDGPSVLPSSPVFVEYS